MPLLQHQRLIRTLLCLYLVATWTTMAGMELLGWSLFLVVSVYLFRETRAMREVGYKLSVREILRPAEVFRYLPWPLLIAMLVLPTIGYLLNAQDMSHLVAAIGSQRWIFLWLGISLALILWPPTVRGYKFFVCLTAIVGLYAIVQSFTGIDLLRWGSERAVQRLPMTTKPQLWRSAGLWGSPMGYMYIVGMHACFILAFILVFFRHRREREAASLWMMSALAFPIVTFSVFTTYVRGGWISLGIAFFIMAFLVSRIFAGLLATAFSLVFIFLFFGLRSFNDRILSLFDPNYSSNSDRLILWKMNWLMFQEYPILGIGWDQNEDRAREYLTRMGLPEAFGGHAHNNYIQVLAGLGLTGFIVWFSIIVFMLWLNYRLWKKLPQDMYWPRVLALGCLGAQIHLHIGGLTECNFKAGATNQNFMVVWGLVLSLTVLHHSGLLVSRLTRSRKHKLV